MLPYGYFRVSRLDTSTEKFAVIKYRQKLIDRGIPEERIFYDFSSGGEIANRNDYQKLLEIIKTGLCSEVVVPMQSRLNRNLLNSELLAEDLASSGTKITILETGVTLDLQLPTDRFIYQLGAILDQQALSQSRITNQDNANQMRKNHKIWLVPFGWVAIRGKPMIDREPSICLLENKEHVSPADIVLEIIDKVIERRLIVPVIREIHRKYGVAEYCDGQIRTKDRRPKQCDFSKDTRFKHKKRIHFHHQALKRILQHPLLVGDLAYFQRDKTRQTILKPNIYPEAALISRQKFELLQASMTDRNYSKPKKHNYPLTGLIYCSICGGRFYSDRGGKRGKDGERRILYYICKNAVKGCNKKRIRADLIEQALIKKLTSRYLYIAQMADEKVEEVESLEVSKLRGQIRQLESLPMAASQDIQTLIDNYRRQIVNFKQAEKIGVEVKKDNIELLKSVFSNPLYWETLSDVEKRQINYLLVKQILIDVDIKDEKNPNYKQRKSYINKIDLKV